MVKMKNILVLGAFGYDCNQLDGQTVKTRNVYNLLEKKHDGGLRQFDTMHVRKNPFSLFQLLGNLFWCDTLIIVPCLNNLTCIFPVVYWLSKILRYDILHICIGGWQLEYFKGNERFKAHPMQLRQSKKIKAFLPEMLKVEADLKNELGFTNTEMFPNFRFIDCSAEPAYTNSETLRLVFLARVDRKKGYDTIFSFADRIRKENLNIIIDFFGPINPNDKEDFTTKLEQHKDVVGYKGVLQQDQVTENMVNYDVMLLPTTIYTEGFPGTILDAYIAGIPVVATEWKHSHEFIDDNKTGFIVPFENCQSAFDDAILKLYRDREKLAEMKQKAFCRRLQYSSETAWNILSEYL